MELLVIQNDEKNELGGLERGFREAGLQWRVVRAHDGEEVPLTMGGAPGLVVLGGAPSVDAPETAPWMTRVMALVRHAHGGRTPVLGVCLGAQLVAQALGGRVGRAATPEHGFVKLALTEDAKSDPVLKHLDGASVFTHHGDAYTRPPGAALLASSPTCEENAFRLGATTYGVQFHPEATPAVVDRLSEGDARRDAWMRAAKDHEAELDRIADGVARGFAGLVRSKLRL